MNPSVTRGRVLAACGIVILSLAFLFAPAVAADRPSSGGQFLLWLLGLKMAREHERTRIDINSATVEELRAVPGMERHQAGRIVAQRPYAKLEDLARADLSPLTIERLARFLGRQSRLAERTSRPGGAPRWH